MGRTEEGRRRWRGRGGQGREERTRGRGKGDEECRGEKDNEGERGKEEGTHMSFTPCALDGK